MNIERNTPVEPTRLFNDVAVGEAFETRAGGVYIRATGIFDENDGILNAVCLTNGYGVWFRGDEVVKTTQYKAVLFEPEEYVEAV